MTRLWSYLRLVIVLSLLWLAAWLLSAWLFPPGLLRPYFARLLAGRVGQFTFLNILLANLLPFFGVPFMNLFHVRGHPGGLYVLPIFWCLYGILLGTNSFVFAGQPVALSVSVLWTRSGFAELLAYTTVYEATRDWALWEQRGLWAVERIPYRRFGPGAADWGYWGAAALLLIAAAARETG